MTVKNLTYSAEMMTNYLQAELISPQAKFEALQTSDGHSLLFSVSTDGTLFLTSDQSGKSAAGWTKSDLSSAQIKKHFNAQPDAKCRTFDAAQSSHDNTLSLGMVVSANDGDHLYLSLGKSNKDISWSSAPNWIAVPYDNPDQPPAKLEIVNIFFTETTGKTEYIVVDIVQDPSSALKKVSRFYIDPEKTSGYAWTQHDLPIDLETTKYTSCVGRLENGHIDGLYTAGHVAGSAQLLFVPLKNVWNEQQAPTPTRLKLPDGSIPSTITTTRNTNLSTDLFAISGSTLHYFASDKQMDESIGVPVATHEVIAGTSQLMSMSHNGTTTLWGRNGSDQVYYISVSSANAEEPSAWSTPVPILSGIESISAYLNLQDGGNTIFASGGGRLEKITQDTTSSSKLWQHSPITLPVPPTTKSISFNSYTTTILVNDKQGLPLKGAALNLSANNRCHCYINGLYYSLSKVPVHIESNSLGSITIVEAADTLNGTTFTVSDGSGSSVVINPMDVPFKKLAALGDSNGGTDKLKAATVTNSDNSTHPLIAPGASSGDLKALSAGLANMSASYNSIADKSESAHPVSMPNAAVVANESFGLGGDIIIAAGDLFNWLKSGVEAVVSVIKDAASDVWHFVAKIAGKVYRAVVDTVEAVVGAAVWIFNAVKTAIKDIIEFVKFLFEWDDIKRTKQVLHNITKTWLDGAVDNLKVVEHAFDEKIEEAEASVAKWAGISDWSPLGESASKPASASASNPMHGQNSGSQHLSHHFQNNAHNITIKSGAPSPNLLKSLIADLVNAMKSEAEVLDRVMGELEHLAHEFSSLSVEDVLKRLVGILTEGVLGSTKVVVDALLNILYDVAKTALTLLDAKIHIPVISDILNDIGIPDLSFLDLFCWITGVAYTVVYKIATGNAPFPDDENTDFLINTTNLQDLKQAFGAIGEGSAGAAMVKLPESAQKAVFVAGHATGGFMALMSDFVSTFEAADPNPENEFGIPSAIIGIIQGGSVAAANFLVPRDAIKQEAVSLISTGTSILTIVCKVVFSGPGQKVLGGAPGILSSLKVADGRATGAIINSILVIPALFCTAYHFYELAESPSGHARSDAIIEEVSNLASYISRISYAAAVNDDDEESRLVIVGVMAVANVAYAGLQTAEAAVD